MALYQQYGKTDAKQTGYYFFFLKLFKAAIINI